MIKTVKAVLFDVANVVVPWDPQTLYRELIPDPETRQHFLTEVITREWHVRHDAGVKFADNRADLMAAFPDFAPHILAWGDRFMEMFSPPNAGTVAIIQDLHALGLPLHALTNMPLEVWERVKALSPAFDLFRHAVVSGEVGLIKPDPAIYHLALRHIGRPASEVLFIDDTWANIAAANTLGLKTHHFKDSEGLRAALAAEHLLTAPRPYKTVGSPDDLQQHVVLSDIEEGDSVTGAENR